jgi:N,N'-diacetyllegionaminate synthase
MVSVKIGNSFVGENNPCFISFEPGATYSSFEDAKKMLISVANSGADAVKFQTFLPGDADRIMGKKDITVKFSDASGLKEELVIDALRRRELSKDEWKKLIDFSKSNGLNFITAPYFSETVDFLEKNKVDAIKVSKGDVNNAILIDKIAKTQLPIILDAREKLEEIDKAIKICIENNNNKIIIMHCPSGYPSSDAGVHLKAISFLIEHYDFPIAFSDHSPNDIMNYAAVSLGAKMLEKTITTDKTISQVEHLMSLELSELKMFVQNINKISNAMGNPDILYSSRVEESSRRSIVSKRKINKSTSISIDDLEFKRPGDQGISCSDGFKILGKKSIQDIPEGQFLQWDQFE